MFCFKIFYGYKVSYIVLGVNRNLGYCVEKM